MKIYVLLMLLAAIVGFSYGAGRRPAAARATPPIRQRPEL